MAIANACKDLMGASYVPVSGGKFLCSKTGRQEVLPDLCVAKYLVTGNLFRRFVAYLDGCYRECEEFCLPGMFRTQLNIIAESNSWGADFKNYFRKEKDLSVLFGSLYGDNDRFNGDDQPVVGVNQYAAKAYCLWLSMLENEGLDTGLYFLPTDQLWEAAAAGMNSRKYPWPKEKGSPSRVLAHYGAMGADSGAKPISAYSNAEGQTPTGICGMVGNVLTWTDSYFDDRTFSLRGSAWFDSVDRLRCSFRGEHFHPTVRVNFVGFRVWRKEQCREKGRGEIFHNNNGRSV